MEFAVPVRQKLPPITCPIQPELALAAAVSKRVGQARYGLWFEGHARFVPLGREVTVVVRNDQTRDWLEHTFGPAVREAVLDICGSGTAVRWAVDSSMVTEPGDRRPEPEIPTPSREPKASPAANRDQEDLFGDPVPGARNKTRQDPPSVAGIHTSTRPARRWRSLSDSLSGPAIVLPTRRP